jgi:membrane protein DedA with SNARE-associated domain
MGYTSLAAVGLRHYYDQMLPALRWGARLVVGQIVAHKAIAIFAVIALEEIGIPLPLPGDAFIAFAGHLIARGRLDEVSAFFAVVLGSMAGSTVLFWLSRKYGHELVHRYGPYVHLKPERIAKVEKWFHRYGPVVIIVGRHVPGFRMVISVFAGLFDISYPVFLASVTVSAAIWAAIFLFIGIKAEGLIGPYLEITPLHLLPSVLFLSGSITYGFVLKRRAQRADAAAALKAAAGRA